MSGRGSHGSGCIKLAAAIVNSGISANDTLFLESEWCRYLIDTLQMLADDKVSVLNTSLSKVLTNYRKC